MPQHRVDARRHEAVVLGLLRRDAVREVLAARRERGQAHGLAARDEDDAEPERRRALLKREPVLERELEDRREEGQAVGDGVVQEPAVEAHVAPAPGRRAQELGRVEAAHGARVEAPAHEGHVPPRRREALDEQDGVGAPNASQEEAREAVRAEAVRLAEGPAPRAEPRELVRVVLLVVLARAALFLDEHGLNVRRSFLYCAGPSFLYCAVPRNSPPGAGLQSPVGCRRGS